MGIFILFHFETSCGKDVSRRAAKANKELNQFPKSAETIKKIREEIWTSILIKLDAKDFFILAPK